MLAPSKASLAPPCGILQNRLAALHCNGWQAGGKVYWAKFFRLKATRLTHLSSLFLCRAGVSATSHIYPWSVSEAVTGEVAWEPCRWVSHTPQIWWIPICDVSTPTRTSVMCVVGWVQPNITMWYYLSLLFEGCPNCHCPLPPSILFHFTHTM